VNRSRASSVQRTLARGGRRRAGGVLASCVGGGDARRVVHVDAVSKTDCHSSKMNDCGGALPSSSRL